MTWMTAHCGRLAGLQVLVPGHLDTPQAAFRAATCCAIVQVVLAVLETVSAQSLGRPMPGMLLAPRRKTWSWAQIRSQIARDSSNVGASRSCFPPVAHSCRYSTRSTESTQRVAGVSQLSMPWCQCSTCGRPRPSRSDATQPDTLERQRRKSLPLRQSAIETFSVSRSRATDAG